MVGLFDLIVPDQLDKVQIQNKTKIMEFQTTTEGIITIKSIDTTLVAISKTTDITLIAVHETSNKTETTQTNNHLDFATEQITSLGIVKPALIAEDWDICLAKIEHHDEI